jgi:type I restriction enzyme S subunit
MSWPVVQVTEVARVVGGATPKSTVEEYWDGDVNWVTPKDLSNLEGKYIADTPRKITAQGLGSCAAELLPANSVLFSSRAPIGHVAINTEPMATNQGFKSFVPCPELDPSFLYWWLDANRSYLQSLGTGATFKEVSKAVVQRIKIPLPPLEEQRRIAGILDKADALRRFRTRALDKLNTLGQAIFHEMFGSVHLNPNGFNVVPLGELIKVSSGQGLTAKQMRPGDFPVYGGNGINGYHDEGRNDPQTIVIGRVGAYCGAVHVTKTECWITDNALEVRKLKPVNTAYLANALRVAELNQYAGRAAQPLVSGSRIYPVEILLPPEDIQNQFEKRLREAENQTTLLDSANSKLEALFSALQHRAFQGEL